MANYIEGNKTPINGTVPMYETTACPCVPNCGNGQSNNGGIACPSYPANWLALWEKWKTMTDEEKNMLFYPLFHFVNMEDIYRKDFDKYLTKDVYEFGWNNCRSIMKIDYELSRQAIPMYAIIYNPINPNDCVIAAFKSELEKWKIYHI